MNPSVLLRSPMLAEGGDVRVVRLYELKPHARGGLADASPATEVLMHLSAPELAQLAARWGAPRLDPSGRAEYGFPAGSLRPLRRFADGGWLEGYGPNAPKPEPLKLERTQTPLASTADYYTYGERPEHKFFSENVLPNQPQFPSQSTAQPATTTSGSGSAQGVTAALGAALAAKQGWDAIKGAFGSNKGGDSAPTAGGEKSQGWRSESGSLSNGLGWDDAGGILAGAQSLTTKEGKFKGAASGAMAGNQLYGWPGAIVGGALGYLQEGGFDDANPYDASGFSGVTMDAAWKDENIARLASNPAASIASKLGVKSDSTFGKILDPAGFLSKHGDEKRNLKAFTEAYPLMEAQDGNVALPDGKIISKKQLEHLAGTWYGATYHPDGNQEGWQQKFQQAVSDIYGYARGGALRPLSSLISEFDTSNADTRHVTGPGTGRSDSIPAQLSDGEYVLTAEDVSLLGDGSNQAGAKRLDEFRRELRKHKGAALARGQISPNAKAPLAYLRGMS